MSILLGTSETIEYVTVPKLMTQILKTIKESPDTRIKLVNPIENFHFPSCFYNKMIFNADINVL